MFPRAGNLKRRILLIVLPGFLMACCAVLNHSSSSLKEVPAGFPAIVFPQDNAFKDARWLLGKNYSSIKIFQMTAASVARPAICLRVLSAIQ